MKSNFAKARLCYFNDDRDWTLVSSKIRVTCSVFSFVVRLLEVKLINKEQLSSDH